MGIGWILYKTYKTIIMAIVIITLRPIGYLLDKWDECDKRWWEEFKEK